MRGWITLAIILCSLVVSGGLLLPGIVYVRTAAQEMGCKNNMKQIGLALHNYHDTNNRFPLAVVPNSTLPSESRVSWMPTLLPFVECVGGRLLLDPNEPWDGESNRLVLFQNSGKGDETNEAIDRPPVPFGPYKPLLCPANGFHGKPGLPPVTHSVGMSGVGPNAAALPERDPKVGLFGYERRTELADVLDGTAHTIMLAETATDNGPWTAGGSATVRGPNDPPYLGTDRPFSSLHEHKGVGGITITLSDGSVRTVLPTMAPQVFEALCTIRGDDPLPPDW